MNEKLQRDIKKLSPVLNQRLDRENPSHLENQLTEIEGWIYTFIEHKRNLGEQLDIDRNRYLMPKTKTMTDMDRKIGLEASIASVKADYEFVCDVIDKIYRQISLGQSLLSNSREELKRSLR